LDDGGDIFEIRNLTNQEDLYLNCEKEQIETDIVGVYRYNDVLGDFPRLLSGTNRFKITGDCVIQFRYKKRYKF
jgi:phage-related protein